MKQLFKNWLFKNKNQSYQQTFWFLPKGLLFVFIFYSTISKSQYNLVPNPSFEIYSSCPNASSQISLAIPWVGTNNSTDYFNACAPSCSLSVPCQSSASFQHARTGSSFAGIWMVNGYGLDYREYLQTEILDTLVALKCYKISFFINLHNSMKYAVNNFGAYLSDNGFTTSWGPAPYTPQVLGFLNKINQDTLGWIEISSIYYANGNEKYISIGNFYDDTDTDTLNTGNGTYSGAYYYIDDVSVIPIDSIIGGMPAFAGNDTSITIGDSVFVGQEIYNLNCNWYDSSGTLIDSNISGIFVSPTSTTYYVVEQNLCGTITYDTVNITVNPVGINETEKVKFSCKVYPNPNTGEFNVELNTNENNLFKLNVMDMQYRILYSEQIFNNSFKLNLDLENGAYMLHITDIKTNVTVIQKLVIQK